MLEQVLAYLKNYFIIGIYEGSYVIADGSIELPFLQDGQYFRIFGSTFNDGVYQYGEELDLINESFDGVIWALAVPRAVIQIAKEIEEWQAEYGDTVTSPYTSESFGGYSYSKGAGSSNADTGTAGWQTAFKARLAPYKKIMETTPISVTSAHQDPPYKKPFNPDIPWG